LQYSAPLTPRGGNHISHDDATYAQEARKKEERIRDRRLNGTPEGWQTTIGEARAVLVGVRDNGRPDSEKLPGAIMDVHSWEDLLMGEQHHFTTRTRYSG
jgi:hypothetical protein